eukprot:gene9882-1_t
MLLDTSESIASPLSVSTAGLVPQFALKLVDDKGNDLPIDSLTTDWTVEATCSNCDMDSATTTFTGVRAVFDSLRIKLLTSGDNTVLTFTAYNNAYYYGGGEMTVRSAIITVHDRFRFAASMSWIASQGQARTAQSGILPVIRLEFLDASGQIDTTDSASVVLAESSSQKEMQTAIQGVVTFSNLRLRAAGPERLSFTPTIGNAQRNDLRIVQDIIVVNGGVEVIKEQITRPATVTPVGGQLSGVLNEPLQPIDVNLFDSCTQLLVTSDVLTTVTATSDSGTLKNAVVTMQNGIAHFTDLTFTSVSAPSPLDVTFTVGSEGGSTAAGQSLTCKVSLISTKKHHLQFKTDASWIAREGQARATIPNKAIPLTRIQLVDSDGVVDTTEDRLVVTVTATLGALSGTTSVTMVNGLAVFSGLKFGTSHTTEPKPALLFTAGVQGSLPAAGRSIRSGPITVATTSPTPTANIRFALSRSVISAEGQSYITAVGTPIVPVIIQLLNSNNKADGFSGATGVTVTATAAGGILTENVATSVNGVVTFNELVFAKAPAGITTIVFTVDEHAGVPCAGHTLTTGPITVTGLAAASIGFTDCSWLSAPDQARTAVANIGMPAIHVQVLTGTGQLDTSNNGLVITASSSTNTLSGTRTASTINGLATFDSLFFGVLYTSGVKPVLHFTADTESNTAAAGTRISSGAITVTELTTLGTNIKFSTTAASAINRPGGSVRAIEKAPLAPILVTVITATSAIDSTDSNTVIIASCIDPSVVLSGNSVSVSSGVASFDQLTFVQGPSSGETSVTFTAVSASSLAAGQTLITGPIAVSSASSQALHFGTTSFVSFAGQTRMVGVSTALPAIYVEVIDSTDMLVSADSSTSITVSEPTGTLNGTTVVTVVNGVAIFRNLVFHTVLAVKPVLTFTASGGQPVAGRQIVSGEFSIKQCESSALNVDVGTQPPVMVTVDTVLSPAPSVVVSDTNDNIDSTAATVFTVTTDAAGATLSGNEAVAVNGVALFSNLQFDTAPTGGSARLTFTASTEETSPIAGSSAISDAITVASTPASMLQFHSESWLTHAGQLLDSAGNVDTVSTGVTIILTHSGEGGISGIKSVAVISGTATFEHITLLSADETIPTILTFTASAPDMTVDELTIASGPIAMPSSNMGASNIQFSTPVVGLAAVRGYDLPAISIESLDSSLAADESDSQTVLTVSASGGSVEGITTLIMDGGKATFDSLVVSAADAGYVVLEFTASGPTQAAGSTLVTGKISVTTGLLRWKLDAWLSGAGIKRTTIVHKVLPALEVEVLTPEGQRAASDVSTIVSLTSSLPTLRGNLEVTVVNGVATFSDLYYIAAHTGDVKPIISVSAFIGGTTQIVSSGEITVLSTCGSVANLVMHHTSSLGTECTSSGTSAMVGIPLAPIILTVLDGNGNLDTATPHTITCSTASEGAALTGTIAASINGRAVFTRLTFTSLPTSGVAWLTFTADSDSHISGQSVKAGPISVNGMAATHMRFHPSFSYITTVGQTRTATANSVMPEIRVQILDFNDKVTQTEIKNKITVTTSIGTLTGTHTVPVVDAVATFTDLRFTTTHASTVLPILTFTATNWRNIRVSGSQIRSGPITVVPVRSPSSNLQFSPVLSAITYEGASLTAVTGIAMDPIVILMTDSDGIPDTTDSETTIEVTASGGTIAGCFCSMQEGRCVINGLTFTEASANDVILTFTAGSEMPNSAVAGKQLTSGDICVSGRPSSAIDFAPDSFITRESQTRVLSLSCNVPMIAIIAMDSVGNLDSSVDGLTATASVDEAFLEGELTVPFAGGRAQFDDLNLVSIATPDTTPQLTFTVSGTETPQQPLAGDSIVSAPMTVVETTASEANILFAQADVSALSQEGMGLTARTNVALPPIVVVLADSCGARHLSYPGTPITVTNDEGTMFGTTTVPMNNGAALFTSLTFSEAPVDLTAVLTFTAGGDGPVAGQNLISGDIVFHRRLLAFQKVFGSPITVRANSPAGGQTQDGMIPIIKLKIVDMHGVLDSEDNVLKVRVAPDDERVTLFGTKVVRVVDGIATYGDLFLTEVPPSPFRLVFTPLQQSTDKPPVTNSLQTPLVTCITQPNAGIRFVTDGTSVYSGEGQTAVASHNAAMSTIKVTLTDSRGEPDISTTGLPITVSTSAPDAVLSGTSASTANGVAVWSSLTFIQVPASGKATLTFTAGYSPLLPVAGKTLIAKATIIPVSGATLRFGPGSSWFITENQPRCITASTNMPVITVQLLNSAGRVDTTNSQLTVTAAVTNIAGTTTQTMVNGVATFNDLQITVTDTTAPLPVLTFTAGSEGSLPVAGKTLTAGPITVPAASAASSNVQFATSGSTVFTEQGQSYTAFVNTPIAVIIDIKSSSIGASAADSSTVITATTDATGATLSGTTATMANGVATFSNLMFVTPPTDGTAVLTFTAGSEVGGACVHNQILLTGLVTLSGKSNQGIVFKPGDSWIGHGGQKRTITKGCVIPTIKVQLVDNKGNPDTSSTGLSVTASASKNTLSGTLTAKTVNGVATFSTLRFTDTEGGTSAVLRFTASNEGNLPVAGKTIASGRIDITSAGNNINFATSNSLFTGEGQTAVVEVSTSTSTGQGRASVLCGLSLSTSTPLPPIIIAVTDSCNGVSTLASFSVTVTTDAPGALLEGNVAQIHNGFVVFDKLKILTEPTDGTATLTFTSSGPYIQTLQTGILTVSSSTVGSTSLRFGSTSWISEGQARTIKTSTNLPSIIIEILDSAGDVDTTDSSTVFTVTSVLGTLGGTVTATASSGVVTFSALQLTAADVLPPKPILTFTADKTKPNIAGKSLASGELTVIASTVNSANLAFSASTAGITTTLGVTLPTITVKMTDSVNADDVSDSTTVITASTDSPASLTSTGASVTMVNGVATFNAIKFATASAGGIAQITFTAGSENAGVVAGQTIVCADINVVGENNIAMRFATSGSSLTRQGQGLTAAYGTSLSTVLVQLHNSVGELDTSHSGLTVTVSTDRGSLSGTTTATVASGQVSFTDLKFFSYHTVSPKPILTFTAGVASLLPVGGDTLVSGEIIVAPTAKTGAGVRFATVGSLFIAEGTQQPATQGTAMSTIKVEILTGGLAVDTSDSTTVITVTADDGTLSGTTTTVASGVATFSALTFTTAPADGTATLTFSVGNEASAIVAGRNLVTGTVTVAGTAKSLMEFKTGDSWISHVGQKRGYEASTNMPTIKIQLTDSLGNADTSENALIITATSGTATVGGTTTATVTSGVATFSALQITTTHTSAPLPTLTFTAGAQGSLTVAGKTLLSGGLIMETGGSNTIAAGIAFKSSGLFTAEGQTTTVKVNAALTSISIQFKNSANSDSTSGVTTVTVSSEDSEVTLSGNTAVASAGVATFTKLTFLSAPADGTTLLTFTCGAEANPNAQGQAVITGAITVLGGQSAGMRFRASSGSWISTQGQARATVVDTVMPNIQIEVIDKNGNVHTDNSATVITISVTEGSLQGPKTATVSNGVATFPGLSFSTVHEVDLLKPVMVFTAGGQASHLIEGTVLHSGKITVTSDGAAASNIRFGGSVQPGFALSATLNTVLNPIIVQLADSSNKADSFTDGVVITASTASGTLSGSTATIAKGVATFSALQFTVAPTAGQTVLTFTAGAEGSTIAAGQTITTGAVTVSGIPKFGLQFVSSGTWITHAGQKRAAPLGVSTDTKVQVQLVDSVGNADTSENALMITVSTSTGTLAGATSVRMVNGVATFALQFSTAHTATPKPVLTFTTGTSGSCATPAPTGPLPVDCKTIVTGEITVKPAAVNGAASMTLAFHPSRDMSVVNSQGQAFRYPTGSSIAVIMRQSSGEIDTTNSVSDVTVTSSETVISGETTAKLDRGIVSFSGIQISSSNPAPRLTFTASGSGTPADGQVIKSGPIINLIRPEWKLRFTTDSWVAFEGQNRVITVNTPMPPIKVQFSDGNSGTDTAVVTATATSSGSLSGTRTVIMHDGIAAFDLLQFLTPHATNPLPSITFTAGGSTLVTGSFIVTSATTASSNVGFASSSYINKAAVTAKATLGVALPNVLLTLSYSDGLKDVTNSITTVVASSAEGTLGTVGANSAFTNGVAGFVALTFTAAPTGTARLTFTVGTEGASMASSQQIVTGDISVGPAMAFEQGSWLDHAGQKRAVMREIITPVIRIVLYGANGEINTADSASSVALSQHLTGTTTVTASKGVAVFDDLRANGNTLQSGQITVVDLLTDGTYNLRFPLGQRWSPYLTATPLNQALEPIVVQVAQGDNLDTTNSYTIVTASVSEGTLAGTTGRRMGAGCSAGCVTFDNLQFSAAPSDGTAVITFTASLHATNEVSGQRLLTGPISISGSPASSIAFHAATSWISHTGQDRGVTVATHMPRIIVEILDSTGKRDTTSSAVVSVSTTNAGNTLTGTTTKPSANGVVAFSNLVLSTVDTTAPLPILTFTSGGLSVLSGGITVAASIPAALGANVQFSSTGSSITTVGASGSAVQGTAMSTIKVELLTAAGVVDTSNSVTAVYVSTDDGSLSGTTATMSSGVATFSALTFPAAPTDGIARLTFTVGSEGSPIAAGQILKTGDITVAGLIKSLIGFKATESWISHVGQNRVITKSTNMPSIKIQLTDSLGNADTTENALIITVTASTGTLGGTTTATMTSGVATFSALQFTTTHTSAPLPILTFTAGAQGSLTVAGKTLLSGGITVPATAQTINNIRFSLGGPGFTAEGQTATATVGQSMLPTSVEYVSSDGTTFNGVGTTTIIVTAANAELSGNTVTMASGVATFTELTVLSAPADGITTFTFTCGADNAVVAGQALITGPITVLGGQSAGMRFRASSGSWISTQGQARATVVDTVMPNIQIEVIDKNGNVHTDNSATVITISVTEGSLQGPKTATVSNGVATFPGLSFSTVHEAAPLPVMVFTAGGQAGHLIEGTVLQSGFVTVTGPTSASLNLAFASTASAITPTSSISTATLLQAVPGIAVVLVQSDRSRSTLSGIAISASTESEGAALSGHTATTVAGIAVFSELTFTSAPLDSTARLTFTANGEELLAGQLLKSADITLQGVAKTDLDFKISDSWIGHVGQTRSATQNTNMPTIKIQLTDSLGNADTAENTLIITAITDIGTLAGTTTGTMSSGVATFSALQYTTTHTGTTLPKLTFIAGTQGNLAVSGQAIASGEITVPTSATAAANILFSATNPAFSGCGQSLAAQGQGEPLPGIQVQLFSSTNVWDTATTGITVTATTDDGQISGGSATITSGVATFTSLIFSTSPSDGFARLTFTAGSAGSHPVGGQTLVTGDIQVTCSLVRVFGSCGLIFVPTPPHLSWIGFEGQTRTIPIRTTMPPIVVGALVNAKLHSSNDATVITVTTSIGQLVGTTSVTVEEGLARFDNLQFFTLHDTVGIPKPILTFTAGHQNKYPVGGIVILSGEITVTEDSSLNLEFASRPASAIGYTDDTTTGTAGQPLSTIVVQLVDIGSQVITADTGTTIIASTDEPGAVLSGTSADTVNGQASFSDIIFESPPQSGIAVLFFTVTSTSGIHAADGQQIYGNVLVHGNTKSDLKFGCESWIGRAGQNRAVTQSTNMPSIKIQLTDSLGNADSTENALTITVTASAGTLAGTTSVTMVNGVATFSALQFSTAHSTNPLPVLMFRADYNVDLPVSGKTIVSGSITVPASATANSNLRFGQPGSGFTSHCSVRTLCAGKIFPATLVKMYDSSNAASSTDSATVVTATTSEPGAVLGGNTATMASGVATFNALTFTTAPSSGTAIITFTAGNENTAPAAGQVLISSTNIITCGVSVGLRFKASDSWIGHRGQERTTNVNAVMPDIRVEVLDTTGNVHLANSVTVITLTYQLGSLSGSTSSTVVRGVATFPHLRFLSEHGINPKPVFTFTAGRQGNHMVAGKSVKSGEITVLAKVSPGACIAFASEWSLYTAQGQLATTTVSSAMDTIRVIVVDSNAMFDPTSSGSTIEITTDDFDATLTGTTALVSNGVAVFSSLIFTTPPRSNFAKLTFTAHDSSLILDGHTLHSGAVTIQGKSKCDLRFHPTESFFSLQEQPRSATVGTNMPTIKIQLTDSLGNADITENALIITVTASTGTLGGTTTATVTSGVATFSALQFSTQHTTAPKPVLTFTAGIQDALCVAGGSITTGVITVHGSSTNGANMHFATTSSLFTYEGQIATATVDTALSTIKVAISTSSHVLDTSLNAGTIVVSTGEPGAVLSGTTGTLSAGVATFTSLTFVDAPSSGAAKLTFTAADDVNSPVAGSSIYSGAVTCKGMSAGFEFRATDSWISHIGQERSTSVHIFMPYITVQVLDTSGNVHIADSTTVVKMTTNMGTLAGVREATVEKGIATFSGFKFMTTHTVSPKPIFTFTAHNPGQLVHEKILESGEITVLDDTSSCANIAFGLVHSIFTAEGQKYDNCGWVSCVWVDTALPMIRIQIIDSDHNPSTTSGITIEVTTDASGATLTGTTAITVDGVATFSALTFTTQPLMKEASLTFTAGALGDCPITDHKLVTAIMPVTGVPNTNVDFRCQDSFFEFEGQSRVVTQNVVIPTVRVELADSLGNFDNTLSGATVTCTASTSDVSGTTTATIEKGVATFSNLIITAAHTSVPMPILSFTVSNTAAHPVNTKYITTGEVVVASSATNVANLKFHSQPAARSTATHNEPMDSLVIRMFSSIDLFDSSNSAVVVTATTGAAGAVLSGNVKVNVNGVFTFDALTFTSPPTNGFATLTFTAGNQGNQIGAGQSIQCGVTVVATTLSAQMDFHLGHSFIGTQGQPRCGIVQVALATIRVKIMDSTGKLDASSNGLIITVTTSLGTMSGTVAQPTVNGVASYPDLVFSTVHEESPKPILTFTAGYQGNTLVAGNSITSGEITIQGMTTPSANLQFSPSDSLYTAEAQIARATILTPMSTIRVQVVNGDGQLDSTSDGVVIAITSDSDATFSGNKATCFGGVATFTALTFITAPSDAPSTVLTFTARSGHIVSGQFLQAGAVLVTGTPNYDLQFAANMTRFAYEGQCGAVTQNKKLPPIRLQLVDSVGNIESYTGLIITASADGKNLQGTLTATTKGGEATFSNLHFGAAYTGSDLPILTFTAGTQGSLSVAGKTITAGPITVLAT